MSAWGDNAVISDCGLYRYQLQRDLKPDNERICLFIMLNPSTADAAKNDPTLRRCMGFAERWGYGRLEVVNLFSLRATDPAELRGTSLEGAFGPEHFTHVMAAVKRADRIVCGWGADPHAKIGEVCVLDILNRNYDRQAVCLGLTKSGAPRHPLYVKGDTVPMVLPRVRP